MAVYAEGSVLGGGIRSLGFLAGLAVRGRERGRERGRPCVISKPNMHACMGSYCTTPPS